MRPFPYNSIKLPKEVWFNKGIAKANAGKCYIFEQDYRLKDTAYRLKNTME